MRTKLLILLAVTALTGCDSSRHLSDSNQVRLFRINSNLTMEVYEFNKGLNIRISTVAKDTLLVFGKGDFRVFNNGAPDSHHFDYIDGVRNYENKDAKMTKSLIIGVSEYNTGDTIRVESEKYPWMNVTVR